MNGDRSTTRRRVLSRLAAGVAGTAGAVGTAGCISLAGGGGDGDSDPSGDAGTTTRPGDALELSFGTEFSENGIRCRPLGIGVQRSVHVRRESGADVAAPDGRQYVFLDVATGNSPGIDPPVPEDFALDVGGELHRGWIAAPGVEGEPVPDEYPVPYTEEAASGREERDIYGGDGQNGWIGFDLPATVDAAVDLLLKPTEAGRPFAIWSVPRETVDRLGAPPAAFSVADVSVPESVAPGDPLTASVTAENAGDGPGRFRAVLAAGDSTTLGGTRVEAGAAGTWEGTVIAPESGEAVEVAVRTVPEDFAREVRIG